MKKKEFSKISSELYKQTVKIVMHNDEVIIGKFDYELPQSQLIYIDKDNEIRIKDIKSIEKYNDSVLYKCVSVTYLDIDSDKEYAYITTIDNIKVGDIVLVDRVGQEVEAQVVRIHYFRRDNAPYPLDKIKSVIKVIDNYEQSNEKSKVRNFPLGDEYKYSYSIVESKIMDKLNELGLNYKQCLRIILLLRTNVDNEKQCNKMLDFLSELDIKTFNIKELERYANLLANEENYFKHSIVCPTIKDKISLIDCLSISDEDNLDNKKEFTSRCKKCVWYNYNMYTSGYKENECIHVEGLNEHVINNINYYDIIAISVNEKNAIGKSGEFSLLVNKMGELILYKSNPNYGGLPISSLFELIPWIKNLGFNVGEIYCEIDDFNHFNCGCGHHLFINNEYYKGFFDKIGDKTLVEIYKNWLDYILEMIK